MEGEGSAGPAGEGGKGRVRACARDDRLTAFYILVEAAQWRRARGSAGRKAAAQRSGSAVQRRPSWLLV